MFKMHVDHDDDDSLTAIACTNDCNRLITGCTGGRIKCWDLSKVSLRNAEDPMKKMRVSWYIQAHKKDGKGSINSLHIVENYASISDKFIVSAAQDNNILLHRLSNGVKVGQFNQEHLWYIKNMAPYEGRRPNLVRDWFKKKKEIWKAMLDEKIDKARKAGQIGEDFDPKDKDMLEKIGFTDSAGKMSLNSDDSDPDHDAGDVDFGQFSSESEDEFAQFKGKNVLNESEMAAARAAEKGITVERKWEGWFKQLDKRKLKYKEEFQVEKDRQLAKIKKIKSDFDKEKAFHI